MEKATLSPADLKNTLNASFQSWKAGNVSTINMWTMAIVHNATKPMAWLQNQALIAGLWITKENKDGKITPGVGEGYRTVLDRLSTDRQYGVAGKYEQFEQCAQWLSAIQRAGANAKKRAEDLKKGEDFLANGNKVNENDGNNASEDTEASVSSEASVATEAATVQTVPTIHAVDIASMLENAFLLYNDLRQDSKATKAEILDAMADMLDMFSLNA